MVAKGGGCVHGTWTDPDDYLQDCAAGLPLRQAYGAECLERGGQSTAPEGPGRERHVVVEFDSYEQALACYNSPGYQAAAKLRQAYSDSEIVIVEGQE